MPAPEYLDPRLTEHRNPRTERIDVASPLEIVDLINGEDATVAAAVHREREAVAAKLLEPLRDHPHVIEIRQRGLMIGIELVRERSPKVPYEPGERVGHRVILEARKRGVMIRPLSDVIVLMPPLSIPLDDLKRLIAVTAASIDAVTR